jgi:hypothetical protein
VKIAEADLADEPHRLSHHHRPVRLARKLPLVKSRPWTVSRTMAGKGDPRRLPPTSEPRLGDMVLQAAQLLTPRSAIPAVVRTQRGPVASLWAVGQHYGHSGI